MTNQAHNRNIEQEGRIRKAVKNALADSSCGLTTSQLSEVTKFEKKSITSALRFLESQGLITKEAQDKRINTNGRLENIWKFDI